MSEQLKATVEQADTMRGKFEEAIAGGGLRVYARYVNSYGTETFGRLVPLEILPGEMDGDTRDHVLCYAVQHDRTQVDEATGEVQSVGDPFRKYVIQEGNLADKRQGFTSLVWSDECASGKAPLLGVAPENRGRAIHPAAPRYDEYVASGRWMPFGKAPVVASKIIINRIFS